MSDGPNITTLAPAEDELSRQNAIYVTALMVVVLIAIYFPVLRNMVIHWSLIEDYQHGFIIAPLAVFFAYERRRDLALAEVQSSWLGLVPLAIGLGSLTIGRLGTELMTMRSGFIFTLIGLVLLLLGRQFFRILAFPLFFLFLMVPLPQSLVNTIAFPLQLVAAKFAVLSLQEFGIPALVEGNIIHLAHTELFVHEACSGLRSLMALVTLGVVFAYFFKRSVLWVQIVLVVSTIPIAIFVNAFRVALTGFLTHYWGEEAAGGAIHDLQGLMTFGLAFFMLLGEARLIDFLLNLSHRGNTPSDSPDGTKAG
jgi:exosortase